MKKVILMAAFMLSTVATFAQNEVGQFSIQPKLGLNIADMTNADDSKVRYGFVGGVEAEYGLTDIFGISAGVLYSQQGVKYDGDGSDFGGTMKLDYINVPVLANIYVVKGLAVKIGLQPGFKVNDEVKVNANGVGVSVGINDALHAAGAKGGVKSVDLAIPVGLSYEYQNFVIDARYNWGVTKALDFEGESSRNSVFQITLGYKFRL